MKKKISFGARPPATTTITPDDWVADTVSPTVEAAPEPPEKIKRLTIDIPLSLHRRVKTGCAREELVIADVVRDFLNQRFPAPSTRSHDDTESR